MQMKCQSAARLTVLIALVLGAFLVAAAAFAGRASAGAYWVNSCTAAGIINAAPVFSASAITGVGLTPINSCEGLGLLAITGQRASNGTGEIAQATAGWAAITPTPAMRIVAVKSFGLADCNLHTDGWNASYFWGDNGQNFGSSQVTIDCHGAIGNDDAGDLDQSIQSSRYLGFHASCVGACTSAGANDLVFGVRGISLEVQEPDGPAVAEGGATNLFRQSGWVRGAFPADFSATDPSGVCGMQTQVNGAVIGNYNDATPDTSNWAQCPGSTLPATVDTTHFADGAGAISLLYSARNAAGAVTTVTKSVNVDNAPVTLSLTGPADVPASSPSQTASVTATASSGPSGADIFCSVDGGAAVEHTGSHADVVTSGLGRHHYECYAQNHATDASGTPARSATQTFDVSIRQPTAEAVSFARIADALRCRTVTVRIRVPGRVPTVKRHGRRIQKRGRAHLVRRRMRRCLARTVRRRVTVVVRQHGRIVKRHRVVRVVLAPHAVSKPTRTVAHGRTTTVSGYLGLLNGAPLAGHAVRVLAAADNGLEQFVPFATVTTGSNGVWTTRVPAGPSRLIEAVYDGDGTEEPAVSAPVKLTVPAEIRLLHVTPRVRWGGTVRIVGQLYGGYLPPGGALVRMRYGYGRRARATFGVVQHVTGDGRFATSFTFGAGAPGVRVRFWFSASLLAHPDYPFAAASSPRRYVVVGARGHKS